MAQAQAAGLVVLLCGCLFPTAGLLVGAARWMLLRKHLSRARWWLLGNAGRWALALFVGTLLAAAGSRVGQSGNVILLLILLIILGGTVGVVAGGVTGYALARSLKAEPDV